MQLFILLASLAALLLGAHQFINRTGTGAKIGFALLGLAGIAGFILGWLKF